MVGTYDDAPVETVTVPQGTIEYRDIGPVSSEVVLFVHSVLVNGDLWRDVVDELAERAGERNVRCLVPTLPLGGHTQSMDSEGDLTPPGLARLLRDFLDAVGVNQVTLVGNDTGGAICQVFLARYPERVSRVVLTNCDAFENFPPPLVKPIAYGARVPGFVTALSHVLRVRPVGRAVFASVAIESVPAAEIEGYFAGLTRDRGVRRDFRRVLRGIDARYTIDAAATFPRFERPVLIAWGLADPIFPERDARRLADAFPESRLRYVAGSRAFVPIDRPGRLADLIAAFVAETEIEGIDPVPGDDTATT